MYILKWLFIQNFLVLALLATSIANSTSSNSSSLSYNVILKDEISALNYTVEDEIIINNSTTEVTKSISDKIISTSIIDGNSSQIIDSSNNYSIKNDSVDTTENFISSSTNLQNETLMTTPLGTIEMNSSSSAKDIVTVTHQISSFKQDTTEQGGDTDRNNQEKTINSTSETTNIEFNSTQITVSTPIDTTKNIIVDILTKTGTSEIAIIEKTLSTAKDDVSSTSTTTSKKNQTTKEGKPVETSKLENFIIYIYISATALASSVIISIIVVSFIVRRRNKIKTLRRPSHPNEGRLPESSKPNYVKSRIPRDISNDNFRRSNNNNNNNSTMPDGDTNYNTSSLDRNAYPLQTFTTHKKQRIPFNNTETKLSQHELYLKRISENRNAPKADLSEELSLLRPESSSTHTSQNSFRKSSSKENSTTRIPLNHGSNFIRNKAMLSNRRISINTDEEDGQEQIELEISGYPSEYSGKKRKSISLCDFNTEPTAKISSSLLIKYEQQPQHKNSSNNL